MLGVSRQRINQLIVAYDDFPDSPRHTWPSAASGGDKPWLNGHVDTPVVLDDLLKRGQRRKSPVSQVPFTVRVP